MEKLLETSELKTSLCHRNVIKMKFKNQSSVQTTPIHFTVELSVHFYWILFYLTKYFCKHEIFLQYIIANMKL